MDGVEDDNNTFLRDVLGDDDENVEVKEHKRYGGEENIESFTTLYYPQSLNPFNAHIIDKQKIVFSPGLEVCTRCQKHLGHRVQRSFQDESILCVSCLKCLGCCILARKDHTSGAPCPFLNGDVVAVIMSFVPEYYQVTLLCRVCRLWLSCFNYDCNRESDIMTLKRNWIPREIYCQYRVNHHNTKVTAFEAKMELAPLLGEFIDNTFKTPMRWLNLCRLIAETKYYASMYDIVVTPKSAELRYTISKSSTIMQVLGLGFSKDTNRQVLLTVSIPPELYNGGTADDAIAAVERGGEFAVFTKSSTLGSDVVLVLDPLTGVLSDRENLTDGKKKKKKKTFRFCCML